MLSNLNLLCTNLAAEVTLSIARLRVLLNYLSFKCTHKSIPNYLTSRLIWFNLHCICFANFLLSYRMLNLTLKFDRFLLYLNFTLLTWSSTCLNREGPEYRSHFLVRGLLGGGDSKPFFSKVSGSKSGGIFILLANKV